MTQKKFKLNSTGIMANVNRAISMNKASLKRLAKR